MVAAEGGRRACLRTTPTVALGPGDEQGSAREPGSQATSSLLAQVS